MCRSFTSWFETDVADTTVAETTQYDLADHERAVVLVKLNLDTHIAMALQKKTAVVQHIDVWQPCVDPMDVHAHTFVRSATHRRQPQR